MTFTKEDASFMQMALEEAINIQDRVSPNPRVGAVIVKDNKVISKGAHQKFGDNHAEINAIENAEQSVKDATIYITLEPCSHTGKTPPCTDAIIKNKFKKVIFAMLDPNPKVSKNNSVQLLQKENIDVSYGLLENEAKEINQPFIKSIKTGIPYNTAKWAMTLDGKTNTFSGDSKWITESSTREHVHQIRSIHDAVLVGKNTFENDDPSLNCRYDITSTQPYRIVMCSNFKEEYLQSKLALFQDNKTIFILKDKPITDFEEKLKEHKIAYILQKNNLTDSLKQLLSFNIQSILIEGGSLMMGSLLDENLIDYVYSYIGTKIVGGSGSSPIAGQGIDKMNAATHLLKQNLISFNNDICLHGPINFYE
ncbi:MAG: riboflavin biosynthesis protein RibD [Planctomycetota bacterium]|nr:MAG: riboflavin biosynthesis protein RibD [Planctomycetota bacterium]